MKTDLPILTNSNYFADQLLKSNHSVTLTLCEKFSDGELNISLPEKVVDHSECKLFFSLTPSINDKLIELFLTLDTLSRHDVLVHVYLPYLPYARQDAAKKPGEAVAIATILKLISNNKCVRSLTVVDSHNVDSLSFSTTSITNKSTNSLISSWIRENIPDLENTICIAPDSGSYKLSQDLAKTLNIKTISCSKSRKDNVVSIELDSNEESLKGKTCIVRDDMIDSGSTMVSVINKLKESGVKHICAVATHGVLSSPSQDFLKLIEGDQVTCLICDSVEQTRELNPHFKVLPITNWLISETE